MIPFYPKMPKLGSSKIATKNGASEFSRFTNLLDKLLAVPHSEIKAKLDAEKEKKRASKRRASSGHASGEKG
jgi:hypothetical protein